MVAFLFALRLEDLEDQILLAKPLVPGSPGWRAMRVIPVMFFCFSSAMVMFTCIDRMGVGGSGGEGFAED